MKAAWVQSNVYMGFMVMKVELGEILALSAKVEWLERESNHSAASNAEISNGGDISHTHTLTRNKSSYKKNKQTPWPLVRERTIPTERPPLVDEI
jgi:hypothetical protein